MKNTFILFSLLIGTYSFAQDIYRMPQGASSSISTFENFNGVRGSGGKTNKGAKGNAWESLKAGESKTLLDISGSGIIQRMWFTVQQRDPEMLRSLRLQIFWDSSKKAAVDVPFGDFFLANSGRTVAFQSALFSSPEGRSYNCYVQMPFRKSARVVITNEGRVDQRMLFYDIDFVRMKSISTDALYFHAYWTRQISSKLTDDFEVLPSLKGKGRYLGMSVGVNTDSLYDKTWWGEGELKIFLDGDTKNPTINGTGTEDYIGTGWGLANYANLYQGCHIADDTARQYNFYRWHVPDAVYFNSAIRVALQQIGGGDHLLVKSLVKKNYPLVPVTVDGPGGYRRLLDQPMPVDSIPEGWVNFYRIDDYSAVSYFYYERSSSALPALPAVEVRVRNLNIKK